MSMKTLLLIHSWCTTPGDASLTLAQTVPLGGVVIVTTPQEASLNIATKSLAMFRKLNVPILGIVENMSYFSCPHCGEKTYIFSEGGGRGPRRPWMRSSSVRFQSIR